MYRKSVKKISPGRKKKKKVQFVGLFHPSEGLLLVPFPEYLHSWFSTFSIFSCLWLLFTGWPHPRWSLFCGVVYIIYLILPFVGRRSPKRLNVYPALQIFTLTTWVWIYIYMLLADIWAYLSQTDCQWELYVSEARQEKDCNTMYSQILVSQNHW